MIKTKSIIFAVASMFVAASAAAQEVRAPVIGADSPTAITGPNQQLGTTGVLETGFEEFTIGDVSGQLGWFGQFGNWQIEANRPLTGAQHVEAVSDGLGQTFMLSPDVGVGASNVVSAAVNMRISGGGVSWEFIPQAPSEMLIVTRIRVNPDFTVDVLIRNNTGGSVFESTGYTMPEGQYVQLGIELDRTTLDLTVFADGMPIFDSGMALAGALENIVFLSAMEVTGSTADFDDAAIIDGPLPREFGSEAVPVNNPTALVLLLGLMAVLGTVAIRRIG
jgi:hypothetical protein